MIRGILKLSFSEVDRSKKGIEDIISGKYMLKQSKYLMIQRKRDLGGNQKSKRLLWLLLSTSSLGVLAEYMSKESNLVDFINHTRIRNILLKHRIRVNIIKDNTGK